MVLWFVLIYKLLFCCILELFPNYAVTSVWSAIVSFPLPHWLPLGHQLSLEGIIIMSYFTNYLHFHLSHALATGGQQVLRIQRILLFWLETCTVQFIWGLTLLLGGVLKCFKALWEVQMNVKSRLIQLIQPVTDLNLKTSGCLCSFQKVLCFVLL